MPACREQLETEFAQCVDLARFMLSTLGLDEDVKYRFSKWDENNKDKYIGSAQEWENVQNRMREILNDLHIDYTEADGEAAFYGAEAGYSNQECVWQGGYAHYRPDRFPAGGALRHDLYRYRRAEEVPVCDPQNLYRLL